jgi:hypothetical protein
MTLDASGNLGIGNTNPSSYDSVADNLVVGTTSGNNGITIAAGTLGASTINFADATTGTGIYAGYVDYQHNGDYMRFGTNGGTERMRITSGGDLLVGTTASYANFTNNARSAALNLQTQGVIVAGVYSITNSSAASNNATVDSLRFLNTTNTAVIGTGFISGIVNIYVSGASGGNGYSANYTLVSNGNGTTSATLTLIGTANTRGTSPVSSVQLDNDGGTGGIKITITYINNSGVVTGGYAYVGFTGLVY